MEIQVKAVRTGYYNHKRQREGKVFGVKKEDLVFGKDGKLLSPKWVELVDKVKVSGGKSAKVEHIVESSASEQDLI